ncbi:MAG: pilus assembly protein PilM [Betaproteobacteria bacterium]|jgi:type IV pilus assembly protein PilM|nr:MAG: pilus assembly protein PilM [Betaproteobacteria bacterium]
MFNGKFEFNTDFFGSLLKPKSTPLIGVDISSSAVKMVELSSVGKGLYRLERYAIEPLPHEAVVDGNIMNLEQVGDSVRSAWKSMGTRVKTLAMAVPSAAVITKKIILDAGQSEDDMEAQVEAEANQYIPFALEEVDLDFQVLGPEPSSPEQVEVMLAAARKEKVEDRVAVAETAGLKATVMDIDAFAAQNALELPIAKLPNGGRDQTIALIDIGASLMNVNILVNNQSVYMREQPFGGLQLTQEIMRVYGMSMQEAEAAKRSGNLLDDYQDEVLAPFMDTLALEVVRALQFFFTSTQYSEVDQLFLSGGTASIPDLAEVVAERTQVNTVIANPFSGMDISGRIKRAQLLIDAPSLLVGCGLALRRFDA